MDNVISSPVNVLERYFDSSVNQSSPVQPDFQRSVNFDEDGNEFVSYVKFDYPSYQKSLGSVDQWSLNNLLKAGINPDFSIHTGNPTRLEGLDVIADFEREADSILDSNSVNEE